MAGGLTSCPRPWHKGRAPCQPAEGRHLGMSAASSQESPHSEEGTSDRPRAASPWTPLRRSVFRALWVASIISYVGAWMHDVGDAWLMTSLSSSPLLVALIQTADSLPVFLLALPAGALADIID